MTFSPRTQLAHARQVFAVGARPLEHRPLAGHLRTAIASGLLGVCLLGTGPVAQAAPTGPAIAIQASQEQPQPSSFVDTPQAHPAAFVDTVFQRKANDLPWVLPTGQVDGLALINLWKAGGVSPDQAFELISLLAWTQSPVIARTQEVAKAAIAQSRATQSLLEIRTQDQAAAFLSQISREKLVLRGVLHASEGDNAMPAENRDWQAVANYWQIMSSDRLEETTSLPVPANTPQDMAAARAHLLRAVDAAGLAGLRVPIANFNDSANLDRLASRIEQANAELQRATGWSGPVLGLRGRVMLTVMSPLNMSMAFPRRPGQYDMVSAWEDVGHEWIHVVGFSLRTEPGDEAVMGGYTLSQQLSAHSPRNEIQALWKALPADLRAASVAAGNRWYLDRDARVARLAASDDEDERWQAAYIGSTHETLAYAWQSHMQATALSGDLLVDYASTRNATDGVMGPRAEEDASVAPVWNQVMARLGQLWWQPAPSLVQHLSNRRASSSSPSRRTPRP